MDEKVTVGRITGAYGIKGWVKVMSFTDPREQIFGYNHWFVQRRGKSMALQVVDGKQQGKGLIARLDGIDDRTAAETLRDYEISVALEVLPSLQDGEFYWYQLEGLAVRNTDGQLLGRVDHLLETGANDVVVVKPVAGSVDDRERLIPYVEPGVIKSVDLDGQLMTVDWAEHY